MTSDTRIQLLFFLSELLFLSCYISCCQRSIDSSSMSCCLFFSSNRIISFTSYQFFFKLSLLFLNELFLLLYDHSLFSFSLLYLLSFSLGLYSCGTSSFLHVRLSLSLILFSFSFSLYFHLSLDFLFGVHRSGLCSKDGSFLLIFLLLLILLLSVYLSFL